jgi:hypothetical protein
VVQSLDLPSPPANLAISRPRHPPIAASLAQLAVKEEDLKRDATIAADAIPAHEHTFTHTHPIF